MRTPAALLACLALAGAARAQPDAGVEWVTLGTAGGPVVHAERSQPANLLATPGGRFLVDAGDGAAERLAAAGLQPRAVDAVFVSHLHADHYAGLQGIVGLRWMNDAPGVLTVYGPPGVDELVAGVVASLAPQSRIGFGLGRGARSPADSVRAVTLTDGADLRVGAMRVRAVRNSHFSALPPEAGPAQSLSYRFDLPGRSIGYTGDTSESEAVARLFAGVDLLVSEVIDLPATVAAIRRFNPHASPEHVAGLSTHLARHHLSAEQAGALAAAARAKRLVFTHLAVPGPTAAHEAALVAGARRRFAGAVAVARDGDRF